MSDPEERRQDLWRAFQCAVACVVGSIVYLEALKEENEKTALVVALVAGFGASWLVSFLIVWARFGWKAARGMRMS